MKINVTEKIYWMGVNDRRKHLFENIWPLPNGVSYNSYLIKDEKTALVDTVEMGADSGYIGWIEMLLEGRELDYLIVNHMELDHAGEIGAIVRRYPNVQIIGNSKTFKILEGYYGITDNLLEVCDGAELELGHHKLKFVFTPWVHWPETMMTYDLTEKVLFSADAFGTFGTLDGAIFDDEIDFEVYREEMRRYYSNIVGKFSNMVQKALAKLCELEVKYLCPLHGPIWRNNPSRVIELYDRWSRYQARDGVVIIYASMYGNNARTADYIARKLAQHGIKQIKIHDVSKTHISYLISDIWKYRGVILGSCAYNTNMFPLIESLTRELEHIGVKNKYLGLFGSYSWNGGGVRNLTAFAEAIGWEQVAPAADIFGTPTPEKLEACDAIALAMAERLKG
ncbi:Alkyldihydroxyacetonephosphate synthase [Mucinivorans hirudinis]|uniref:Alkyldihydroxyacetonephosphate synthase n=1 Tax=Mucinivorans hirudinis TaxID=1433126 RepID=A0A060R632_9BACT|nr:Alkyldihydroxyacetonephosphate synthase [Mucinivorans hirudinis]